MITLLQPWFTSLAAPEPGSLVWEKRYNGDASADDSAWAVAVDASGNVAVTGQSTSANGFYDYYTAKYAARDGALLWEKRYNGDGDRDDVGSAVAVDGEGNMVVTGRSIGVSGTLDYYTVKYAAHDGTPLWQQRYNGAASGVDRPYDVAVDAVGNVVVTGQSTEVLGDSDYYTAKYSRDNGTLLWERRYNGPSGFDVANSVALDSSGNVVVTGTSFGANPDFYTAKYSGVDGALLWERRYNGEVNSVDNARSVVVDSTGNVVVTGTSRGRSGHNEYYTAKYASGDGALLWEKRYSATIFDAFAFGLAVDRGGNVVVTGQSMDGNRIVNHYTVKYDSNGALLWVKNGPGHTNAVTVDSSGNVVIAGSSANDYYTAEYAFADGSLLWEKRYNGPGNAFDVANAVAVDSAGNVVVAGNSLGDKTLNDYCAIKYEGVVVPPARPPYGLYLRGGSDFANARGQQEKYFGGTSSLNGYTDPGGYWYYILPNGALYEFTPPFSNPALTGVLVTQLGTAYYNNPGWLTYKLFQRDGSHHTNYRGQQEKYFGGTASAHGYNDPGGPWYYILPGGDLHEFTPPYSNPALTGVLLARLGTAYYNFPGLLPVKLEQRGGSYFTNFRGQQEKYLGGLFSFDGYDAPDGYWYYILPNGDLYEFTPPYSNPALDGVLVEQVGPALYDDPSPLLTNRVQFP